MTDATTETWPDLPPIVDERGYQAARAYAQMLEARGVTGDVRTEHGALLLKLRRACELYEKTTPGAFIDARMQQEAANLVTIALDAGKRAEDWHRLADERAAELVRVMQECKALKVALETMLVNQGAGMSPYAQSQPSDACEIEQWKAPAERAREDLEALEHKFSEARMDVLVAQAEAKAVRELERRTAWSNGQIADWHKLADERSAELVRVMADRDRLDNACTNLRARSSELETKLREAGHEIAQMASEWSKEVAALQTTIANLQRQLDRAESPWGQG